VPLRTMTGVDLAEVSHHRWTRFGWEACSICPHVLTPCPFK
jgi:hypothetical protein